jgi:hypothetical protein
MLRLTGGQESLIQAVYDDKPIDIVELRETAGGSRHGLIMGGDIMRCNNSNGSRAAWARGFAALCAVLAMGVGLLASPAAAQPFAYVIRFPAD